MGTTRVKVVDLSSENQEVKASRKHAAKIKPQIEDKETNVSQPEEALLTEEAEQKPATKKSKKTSAVKQTRHSGANYRKALESIDKEKLYDALEAIKILEDTSFTKFDPTVEIHLNVSEKNLRGQVNFPHSVGEKKQKRYLVFAEKFKSDNPNVILASEDTVAEIETSRLKPSKDFDVVIASATYMPKLVRIAKILGPAGMMPNPKNGTITNNPQGAIEANSSDAFEFRTDPTAPVIHLKLGKLSSKKEAIYENLKALVASIGTTKIKKATIKTTMGPGLKLDLTQIS